MTKNLTRLYSVLDKLPFKINKLDDLNSYYILYSDEGKYLAYFVNKREYNIYLEYVKLSKNINKSIYEIKDYNEILLVFDYENQTESNVKKRKILPILEEIFDKSSFEIELKKDHLVNLNNIYKVLDNKFSYLEMRIREIELSPVKNDISWIILSKYNIVLDAKIYLYDLQTDIFKSIDKKETIKYGLISRDVYELHYSKSKILPSYDSYYGPLGMLFCRYYLTFDLEVIEDINKLDSFNQKYFSFMSLYILILNLNLGVVLDNYSINNYLLITKKIKAFINAYKAIMEK